ncbi:MAG: hypothetical protein PVF97_06270 [Desulfobacterales bacterium]|jgi:hypothetical protein
MSKKNLMAIIRENRTLFIVIAVGLFLIELEIFVLAAMKSGRQSVIQVMTPAGEVIYESDGKNLSQFDKYYFEQNFGPIDQYELRLHTRERPFPFRAWFVAAFGLPISAILLFAFVVKAYLSIFYADRLNARAEALDLSENASGLERFLVRVSRYNIFIIGFLVLMGIMAYWVVPNFIAYISRLGVDTLIRYKWFFLAAAVISLGLLIWVIYLRYLLARRAIESRTEVEKHRLELEYRHGASTGQLGHRSDQAHLVDWRPAGGKTTESDASRRMAP